MKALPQWIRLIPPAPGAADQIYWFAPPPAPLVADRSLGHGGGHTSWTCRVCDQTVYGPPLNTHFQPRADKRTLGFGGFW